MSVGLLEGFLSEEVKEELKAVGGNFIVVETMTEQVKNKKDRTNKKEEATIVIVTTHQRRKYKRLIRKMRNDKNSAFCTIN